MKWKIPPKIKIYEALGAVGDERVEVIGNEAKIYSSSRNKFYNVKYDPGSNAIMANDNGSFWQGYLGYPAVAFLMKIEIIKFDPRCTEVLRDIAWKDINTKFENNFNKTSDYVHSLLKGKGISIEDFLQEVDNIYLQIQKLGLSRLGGKAKPPKG
jgi:hypothetical protein